MAAAMNWANVPGYGGADDNPSPGVSSQRGAAIQRNRLEAGLFFWRRRRLAAGVAALPLPRTETMLTAAISAYGRKWARTTGAQRSVGPPSKETGLKPVYFFGAVADLPLASRRCRSHGQRQCCSQQLARTEANGHEPRGLNATWGRHPKKPASSRLVFFNLVATLPHGDGLANAWAFARSCGPRCARPGSRCEPVEPRDLIATWGRHPKKNRLEAGLFFWMASPRGFEPRSPP